MYRIVLRNCCEVRMGSPYNMADIVIEGGYVPPLVGYTFQDKYLISPDGNTCYLVQWETHSNEPGFKIWKLDDILKTSIKYEKIVGCCDAICLKDNQLEVTFSQLDEAKKRLIQRKIGSTR